MKDKLVSLGVAYKLKDLGFDWQCRYSIDISDNKEYTNGLYNTNKELESLNRINTPELWQVNKWLREVHSIDVSITYGSSSIGNFGYYHGDVKQCNKYGQKNLKINWTGNKNEFKGSLPIIDLTYEEALVEGLELALTLL